MHLDPDVYVAMMQVIPTLLVALALLEPSVRLRRVTDGELRAKISRHRQLAEWAQLAHLDGKPPPFGEPDDFYEAVRRDAAAATREWQRWVRTSTRSGMRLVVVVLAAVFGIGATIEAVSFPQHEGPWTAYATLGAAAVILIEIAGTGFQRAYGGNLGVVVRVCVATACVLTFMGWSTPPPG